MEKPWFKFEGISGMPKPLGWQGYACYGIQLISLFLLILIMKNYGEFSPIIIATTIVISLILLMIVAMFKSNYKENLMKYKKIKSDDGENKEIYVKISIILGLLSVAQGAYILYEYGNIGFMLFILALTFFYISFRVNPKRKMKVI
ncbi:hypothetical protein [Methanobacterium ferruginis]|uniref:hypothetical protein n=1 Tax=Methanobacterium ferruginis TaxID=710191 RepID=UPI002573353D|nr:hypothetical protein [Methanobacterium ferruginis]BDZ68624.1 hypothetical protein GCM10025860_20720 [Methanobacterium ferruginis]